jgi:hypothetical protein
MISKHKMRLRYHDICGTALSDFANHVTTANCGWNASQKEVNMLREFIFASAMVHRDKTRRMIEAENKRKTNAADKVPT